MLFWNILKIFVRAFCRIICRNVAFRGKILCYPGQLFVHIRSSANKHVCSEQEKALSITNKAYQSSTNTCLETTLSTINNQKQMHAVQSRAARTYLKIDTTHVQQNLNLCHVFQEKSFLNLLKIFLIFFWRFFGLIFCTLRVWEVGKWSLISNPRHTSRIIKQTDFLYHVQKGGR